VEDIKENFRTIARRMRWNIELEKLYKDVNTAAFIKLQRMDDARKHQENTPSQITAKATSGET
jgi:hypothetical protein